MSSSDGKGSEEEDGGSTGEKSNELSPRDNMGALDVSGVYIHRDVYKRRFLQEVVSTDDDSALSESAEASEYSSESGHSSHRGGNSSSGGRRRKRKKATIKYTTKSAAEGGDGRRTLLAATLKRTVEWLIEKEVRPLKKPITEETATTDDKPPPLAATHLVQAFLAGYRQYCTPVDLFHVVEAYYYRPPTKGKLKRRERRRRALHFLSYWVQANFAQDFYSKEKPSKKKKRGSFVVTASSPTSPKQQQEPSLIKRLTDLLNLMGKKFEEDVNKIKLVILRGAAQKPQRSFSLKRRKKVAKLNGRVDVMSLDTRALAEQMTLLESEMFLAIRTTEFFNQAWKNSSKKKTSPHIVTMVERFNTISYWVASTIVMCKDLRKRITILKKFINLAEICLEIRNFSSLMAILGGLNNSAVLRLKQTWAGLKGLEQTTFEGLNNMMESKLNYKKYRDALTQEEGQKLPLVPYLGVYLRDLTFIDDGNPDYIDELINFQKVMMLGEVMLEVREWQSHGPYDLKRNADLEAFLMKLVVLPEDVLYKMSESLETSSLSDVKLSGNNNDGGEI